ncbi:MAG: methyltransferase domain-containing protein [Dehalococcoidia bacterium]|nr:methyltransferase domain-containing protein [Dehalococcoidia bacterium]
MYRWDAEEYRTSSSNQKKWALELLSKLDLKGSERVLDIGCGDGEVTAAIAQRVPRGSAVGIDSSRDMVDLAATRYPPERFPNITFFLKDAREIDFDEEFDAVFSNACLHWVVDHQSVLAGVKRCLKPNGRMLLQMGGKGNAATVLEAIAAVLRMPRWAGYFEGFDFPYAFYGPEEYRSWLAPIGFQVNRVELLPKDMVHEGAGAFAAWIRTTWLPYTQRVPESLREAFIREIVSTHARIRPPDGNGSIHFTMVRLEVEAEKGAA